MSKPKGVGLRALEGKEWISWEELSAATGLTIKTLKGYVHKRYATGERLLPRPEMKDHKNVSHWRGDNPDIRNFITGLSRPGRGKYPGYVDLDEEEMDKRRKLREKKRLQT